MGTLFKNFVEYFNDNVNMMAMASSIAALASGLAGQVLVLDGRFAGPIWQAQGQMVICVVLVALLRQVGVSLYRRAKEDSVMHSVYDAMLSGLPWFLRVPTMTLLPAYIERMYEMVSWDPSEVNKGEAALAFLLNLIMFVSIFMLLLCLGSVARSRADAAKPDARWSTFWLQASHLACMMGAGMCMLYNVRLVVLTLAGPPVPSEVTKKQLAAVAISVFLITCVAWFILASTLPNQKRDPTLKDRPFAQTHLTCQQYVVVYTWLLSAVNMGWEFAYVYIGGALTNYPFGMFVFCCWLFSCLAFACLLASTTPDNNFYDMGPGNDRLAAACLMNYWLVEFITWRAQTQVMTSLMMGEEGEMKPYSLPIIAINIVVGLFVCGAVHACNRDALLLKKSCNGGLRAGVLGGVTVQHSSLIKRGAALYDDESDGEEEDSEDDDEGAVCGFR